MFSLSNRGQLGGLVSGIITVAIVMMVLGMMAIVGNRTKAAHDNWDCGSYEKEDGGICCPTDYTANTSDSTRCVNDTAPTLSNDSIAAGTATSTVNNTLDNLIEGSEDGSDMSKILLFAIPAIAVLGLFIGLTRLA